MYVFIRVQVVRIPFQKIKSFVDLLPVNVLKRSFVFQFYALKTQSFHSFTTKFCHTVNKEKEFFIFREKPAIPST